MKDYRHQIEELNLSRIMPDRGLLWEMGTGKSKGMIDILRDKYNANKRIVPTLIFSPSVTLYNWKDEFKKWSKIDPSKIFVIEGTKSKRIKLLNQALETKNCIIIINYEAVQSDEVYKLLLKFEAMYIVADESHNLKNHKSKRAKKVVKLGDIATNRFIMSGTPILNSLTDIFHQFRFLDSGKTFGKSYYVFQDKYMMDKNAAWKSKHNYFPEWVPRPETFDKLNALIYAKCTRVTKKEALPDLPPLVEIKKYVDLSPEQARAYKSMKSEFVAFVKSQEGVSKAVVAQLALTRALRLQQIVSGYVMTDEGETIHFKKNPRLELTEELLTQLTPTHKVILWCCFKEDYKKLGNLCTRLKINHVFITGAMNGKQKNEAKNTFNNDEDCRVVIANRKAGGIGINLVASDYSIIYSRNFSYGDDKQSEARNHRGGSEIHEKITKIELCARDTIDEIILEAISNKQKLSTRIIDWARE